MFGKLTFSPSMAGRLLAFNFDPGVLRPYVEQDGFSYITVNRGGTPTPIRLSNQPATTPWFGMPNPTFAQNAQMMLTGNVANLISGTAGALLTRDEWLLIDTAVQQAARPRLKLWTDLRARVPRTIPNGLSVISLLWAAESDAGNATISMSPLRKAERDRPTYDQRTLPMPLVHADWSFDLRELAVSRRNGIPLDTSMAEKEARRCAEAIEKLALGSLGTFSYGGGTVYGLRNFPDRVTSGMTLPTAVGWTPETTYNEFLGLISTMATNFFYGPFMAYFSPAWQQYLARKYNLYNGEMLQTSLSGIPQIAGMQQLDYMTGYEMIFVQMDPDIIQAVSGMELTTLQWEEEGGLELCFKILGIQVPHLKSDQSGKTGILHAVAA